MVTRVLCIFSVTILFFANALFAQSTPADTRFSEAVTHFDNNRLDESHNLFYNLTEDFCGEAGFGEVCINSKVYKVRILRRYSDYDRALELLEETEELVHNEYSGNPDFLVNLYLYKVYVYEQKTELENARTVTEKLAEMLDTHELQPLSIARAKLGIGYYEDAAGNYQTAIETYQEGLSILEDSDHTVKEKKAIIQGLNNLGVSYRKSGMPEEAMEKYLEANELIYELHGENHLLLSFGYNNIGTVYYGIGDFGLAAEYFERAATIISQNLGSNNERIAAILNNAGVAMFRLGNYQKAAEFLEEAQRVKVSNLGENHIDTAVGYSNLASIHIMNGDYDQAERNYRRSIEVRIANLGDGHPDLIDPMMHLGAFYNDMERFEESRSVLERALEISKDRLGDNHPKVSELHHTIGNNFKHQGLLEEANEQYAFAIQSLYGDYSLSGRFDVERDLSDPVGLVYILRSKAEVYRSLHDRNGERDNLLAAKTLFSWAIDLVDFLQRSYQNEASKLNLLETNYSIYTESVEILDRLYHEDSDPEYLEEVFNLMEKSRSRVALELLQDLSARTFAGLPDSVFEKERELNANITNLIRSLESERRRGVEADKSLISQLTDSLFYARRSLENFTSDLEQNYPSYYQLKFDQRVVTVEETLKLLGDDTTLLSYMVGEESFYVLKLSASGLEIKNLGSPDGLEEQVMELRKAVTGASTDDFITNSSRLYEILLEPVMESIETHSLLILPDQALHYLPFEMLLTEPVEHNVYHRMPYLVKQFDISYAPSATVYSKMHERRHQTPKNLLALAPYSEQAPGYEGSENAIRYAGNLEPLLLTGYETREIDNIFRERQTWSEYLFPNRTRILRNSEATKNGLLQNLENYSFIHFATHAFVNEENPQFSGIALYPEDEDGGITYVDDIYNIQMNADLVVLGACETGLGSVHRGEGMIGFTRAFIYAGAANLAVSMWRVNDQPTATMMINFYSAIREGNSYSRSLRQAKLSMIDNPATAAPRNWAAFVLHGR